MILLLPKFPPSRGQRHIYYIRVYVDEEGTGWVIKVTDRLKRLGQIIATCGVQKPMVGDHVFVSTVQNIGHRALCALLCANGVRGFYLNWLRAVERGDLEEARNLETRAGISFRCDVVEEEEAKRWKVTVDERFEEEMDRAYQGET